MINDITPRDLKAKLDAGEPVTVIDVREDWEVNLASVNGSVNIPMNDIPDSLDRIPKDVPVAILCHSGMRSRQVAFWLGTQGYSNVVNVAGGIDRWSREVDPSVPRY